jgi:predicted AAA+ superfamily ATPase
MLARELKPTIAATLERGQSALIFGARQTGKTTLALSFPIDRTISLVNFEITQRFDRNPAAFIQEIRALHKKPNKIPLIFCDEIQKLPKLFDAIQYLIDEKIAQFILTVSSARKIRRHSDINLLPGRVVTFSINPLSLLELPEEKLRLDHLLMYGSMPGIITAQEDAVKEQQLTAYSQIYLEEEVKAEALVKNLNNFSEFLELAALDAGNSVNFSKLSQQIAISHTTIETYYQILADCLLTYRIPAYTGSPTKRRLTKAPKYLFFDLGVRRLCAKEFSSNQPELLGKYFEQLVGLELIRHQHQKLALAKLYYWRDHNGAEVDYLIKLNKKLIPIEVKLSDTPSLKMAKHLLTFIDEHQEADKGYIICCCPEPMLLHDKIMAIPWQQLLDVFN